MEFKYLNDQNRRTTSPPPRPLSDVAYVSRFPLRGCEFVSGSFSDNISAPRVSPTAVPINAEEAFQRELETQQIQRELEKEEIRRQIIADEMALVRRRELEEEVRREMMLERTFRIPMQRSKGISSNNHNMYGGSHFHVDNTQAITQNNKDKLILLARPNVGHYGGKRKAVTPAVQDNESLQKKVKQEWSCELCHITTTSEKGLNDHIQGKKHKAKTSKRTQKIGLDLRPEGQTLHPCLTPAHTGKLESKEEDQDVQKSKGLIGLDNQNETSTSKEARETNTSTKRKKVRFVELELDRNCHTNP